MLEPRLSKTKREVKNLQNSKLTLPLAVTCKILNSQQVIALEILQAQK